MPISDHHEEEDGFFEVQDNQDSDMGSTVGILVLTSETEVSDTIC